MPHKITVELEVTEALLNHYEKVAKAKGVTVEKLMEAALQYLYQYVTTPKGLGDLDE